MHFGPFLFYQQICPTGWVEEYCLLAVSSLDDLPIKCEISHTFVKAREIYLFIYLFVHEREVIVTWFLFGLQ